MKGLKLGKKSAVLLLTSVMSLSLFGCGGTPTGDSVQPAQDNGQPSASGTASASGKLVLYSAGPQKLADNIVSGFEAKTGVKVEMFQGTTGKILAQIGRAHV